MGTLRTKLAAFAAALLVAACGGGDNGPQLRQMVTFGDSLSDVGTYKVGTVAAVGGGKWTVNSPTAQNWTEVLASTLNVPAPCPAQTGLLPNIPGLTGAPVADMPACFNYAQGSSRVSNPFGPNAVAFQAAPFNQVNLGLTAVPVRNQMAKHLARRGGQYAGDELVTVMAGGNDLFINFAAVASAAAGGNTAAGAAAAAGFPQDVQAAVAAGGPAATNAAINAAVANMGAAGAELATLVKTQVVAAGAKFVVVVNLPDVSQTPFGLSLDAQTQGLVRTMVTTFNSQLQAGLNGTPVLYVDAYTQGQDQFANPAKYNLTNVTTPACSTTSPANPLAGSSLTCTTASLVPGDTSGFLFADTVHLTPLGYRNLANVVIARMHDVGWI